MNLTTRQSGGVSIEQVEEWSNAGLLHGFMCRDAAIDPRDKRFTEKLELLFDSPCKLQLLHQTHSKHVVDLRAPVEGKSLEDGDLHGDGWLVGLEKETSTARPGARALYGVLTADCVPVLIRLAKTAVVAALHCGWRGTAFGILPETLARIGAHGVTAHEIEVAIGPGAGPCCYEVGDDVITAFIGIERTIRGGRPLTVISKEGKTFVDIKMLLMLQAQAFGVPLANIVTSSGCTICNKKYFSVRREKALAGRQVSFIGSAFSAAAQ